MADRLKALLTDLRAGYEAIYGGRLAKLVLHGSQARGDADSESDIDVTIVLHGPVDLNQEWRRTDDFVDQFCFDHDVLVAPFYLNEDSYRCTGCSPG